MEDEVSRRQEHVLRSVTWAGVGEGRQPLLTVEDLELGLDHRTVGAAGVGCLGLRDITCVWRLGLTGAV